MQEKTFLFESNINEIFTLINENQSSFDKVWDLIKEKINDAVKNIKSKEEAREYLVGVYKKIKHFPDVIKKRTFKYALSLLIAAFGLSSITGALPGETKDSSREIRPLTHHTIIKTPTNSSDSLKNFLKEEEGFSLKAYTVGDKMVTVGWGHAEIIGHSKFKVGQIITKEEAQHLFDQDVKYAEDALSRLLKEWKKENVKVQVNQDMYDAMVSMIFNMGIGKFRRSEFIELVKHNKLSEAKNKILTTNANYRGLKERRKKEAEMFGHGILALKAMHTLVEYIRKEIEKLLL